MRFDDLFNDIDNNTAYRLSEEYPVLKDDRKERLYAMSKRKYDMNDVFGDKLNDVSGVEKYRRPKWYKSASIAAAAVLLVGGIGGSMAFISRNANSPSAEVEEIVLETTEAEEVTEEATETEEVDADAIAKDLIDDYRAFICDLFAGNLEVDKSDIITKTVKTDDGQFEREFYRVTDQKYPTWADLEKRCYEIFDKEQGQKILEMCTEDSEEINGSAFMCVTENGYYIEKGIHDNGIDPLASSEYDMNVYTDESGNIIANVTETELSKVHDYPIPEKIFTIVNTADGWRISDVTEKPVETKIEDIDADAIAKELTDAWMECLFDIHGRTLEVDRSSIVTKTITTFDGEDEFTRDFYRVTDPRYPTWEDLEKYCYEICDAELGKTVLDACACAKEEDIDYRTLIYTTDEGYYVNTETCDISDKLYKWLDDEVKGEFDENGNIITTRSHIDLDVDPDHAFKTKFTITNTADGWRISKADEELYGVPESDNYEENIQ